MLNTISRVLIVYVTVGALQEALSALRQAQRLDHSQGLCP
ncbi:hypothetical protein OROMI_002588 [Orobanche minor]